MRVSPPEVLRRPKSVGRKCEACGDSPRSLRASRSRLDKADDPGGNGSYVAAGSFRLAGRPAGASNADLRRDEVGQQVREAIAGYLSRSPPGAGEASLNDLLYATRTQEGGQSHPGMNQGHVMRISPPPMETVAMSVGQVSYGTATPCTTARTPGLPQSLSGSMHTPQHMQGRAPTQVQYISRPATSAQYQQSMVLTPAPPFKAKVMGSVMVESCAPQAAYNVGSVSVAESGFAGTAGITQATPTGIIRAAPPTESIEPSIWMMQSKPDQSAPKGNPMQASSTHMLRPPEMINSSSQSTGVSRASMGMSSTSLTSLPNSISTPSLQATMVLQQPNRAFATESVARAFPTESVAFAPSQLSPRRS